MTTWRNCSARNPRMSSAFAVTLLQPLASGAAVRHEVAGPVAAQPPERGLLQVGRGALAADLGALLLGRALDAVEVVAQGEVEAHLGERVRVGVVAAHGRAAAGAVLLEAAAGLAVERERHGVEDGGLAGAGGAGDQEEAGAAEVGEVQRLEAGVGAERLHGDDERLHPAASRRRRSSASMTAASSRAAPPRRGRRRWRTGRRCRTARGRRRCRAAAGAGRPAPMTSYSGRSMESVLG